jgi:DNA-binding transcriptional LysR family regulator
MVEFRGLETFYWVVTLGSFGQAARKLNTTQPAISQRIAHLEQDVGAKLINRGARRATPTADGRELLVYAEKILGLREDLLERVGNAKAMSGVLRLGVAETIVHSWLPQFIKAINRHYPNLTIEVEVDITPSLRARLLAQEIELAFLVGPLAAATVRNTPLDRYRLAFLASPDLRLTRDADLGTIAAHPIFTFARGTAPYEQLRALFRDPELPPVRLNASSSLATVVRLAIDGLGVAVIPSAIAREPIADGALVEVATGIDLPELSFSASWLATPHAAPIATVAQLAARVAREHRS